MGNFTIVVAVLSLCAAALAQQPPRDPARKAAPAPAPASEPAPSQAALEARLAASPGDTRAARALAAIHVKLGDFDKAMSILHASASANPGDPAGHQLVAVHYWDKAAKDKSLPVAQQLAYISDGIAATDRALELKPDYVDALTYKNIFLRMRANHESDPAQKQLLIAEADTLRNRAVALNKPRTPPDVANAMAALNGPPPPPPPPYGAPDYPAPQAPVRVGGNIKPPTKIRNVNPVYPAEAQEARIQGVVILETTIDPAGRVSDAKVLRSIPLLDQAAIDAVMQWEFTPTLMNGAPVSLIMTVTVNFTLE